MNNIEFTFREANFLKFLAEVFHDLPGPKHPVRKYFEIRKNKKILVSQNRSYSNSSNPEIKLKVIARKEKRNMIII